MKITDGTDQDERTVAALQPGYFNVDELSFEALLALGAEFAAKVNFHNLRNEVTGNWGELLSADEAVIMAMIVSTDMKRLESDLLRHASASVEALAHYVYQLAFKFNFWLTRLDAVEQQAEQGLGQKLMALVEEKLATELHNLGLIVNHLKIAGHALEGIDFAVLSTHWAVQTGAGPEPHFPRAKITATADATLTRQQLRAIFYTLFNAISYLKSITPIYLQESLGSQLHDPATGLFMAFLKLYQRAQQQLNRFTQRHLDFYYSDVLGVTPQAATPERLYLCFEAEAGSKGVLIAKGCDLTAGKDEALREIIYRSDNDLWVTDAQVAALHTLYLQRDALLSPEYELGYVSRIKANRIALPSGEGELRPWPLFGAEKTGMTTETAADASIGFAIASPVLLLREGERHIEVSVILTDTVAADAALMSSLLCKASSEQEFIALFGRVVSRYLFSGDGWLSDEIKAEISAKADTLLRRISADEVRALLNQERRDLFHKLFNKIFTLKLTGRSGWVEVADYLVVPLIRSGQSTDVMGFTLCFSLGHEIEAITAYQAAMHGSGFDETQPLLQCCINPHSNFYPYSAFQDLLLQRIEVEVEVIGLKSLQAYNNHGQLDPSKPFLPFGPLPSTNSYFVVGAHEIAAKTVLDLNVVCEWAELPNESGGFENYYSGYATAYKNDCFKVEFSALADGVWQPKEQEDRRAQPLFNHMLEGGRVDAQQQLTVPVLRYAKSLDASITEEQFSYEMSARAGFFKLALVEPATAFGHRDYPALLTTLLSENGRRKKPLPLPNPPYTPTLNRISLDYRARGVVDLAQGRGQPRGAASSFHHIHPFGIETIGRNADERAAPLLPHYGYEGNLFIGLSASQLAGRVTLFFHLAADMAEERAAESQAINWFYLAGDRWQPLEKARLLSDSTDGFLTSGIVTLDIPPGINHNNSVMPGNLYWLRACTRRDLSSFCSLYSVQTHAVKVTHQSGKYAEPVNKNGVAKKWQPLVSIPGIGRITQVGMRLPGTPAETRQQLITRVSEQLHHKNRASTPWDYERLILQQFANVFKVKCFPGMSGSGRYPAPGHLLIVVVPYLRKGERQSCPRAMMNSVELGHIRRFVQSLASPFATIEVRNPAYEQVQVRCSVKFRHDSMGGHNINRLDKAIADYICPWENIGYKARFGWSIRQKDIESYVRGLEYVEYVTNFSILHITEDGSGGYHLYDSARENSSSAKRNSGESNREALIQCRYPWSLAIPAKHQFIEMIETRSPIAAAVTGVSELEVGGTFIISGNDNVKEE